jgi:hypothetical protein
MSVPLRQDQPEFESQLDENLTTADLARGKRPAMSESLLLADDRVEEDRINEDRVNEDQGNESQVNKERIDEGVLNNNADPGGQSADRPRPVLAARSSGDTLLAVPSTARAGTGATSLFPSHELEELRHRWSDVQTAFVDEPRSAVEQADGLVAAAMKRLAEVFAEERSKLEQHWDRGDNVSTEDLRLAFQRYRSFFQRLLSI